MKRRSRRLLIEELESRLCPAVPDVFEPDDSPASAAALAASGAQTRSLHTGTDVDWVSFTLSQAGEIVLETNGGDGGDTQLWLYAAGDTENEIGFDEDGGNGYYSRLAGPLAAGTYFAKVTEYGGNDALDAYSLRLQVYPPSDLVVTAASANRTHNLGAGDTVRVKWTVRNRAGAAADPGHDGSAYWYDQVYLSADETVDASDVALGYWSYSGNPLRVGKQYSRTLDVRLPDNLDWAGRSAFILVSSDNDGEVADSNPANDVRAIRVDFDPVVQLVGPGAGRLADPRTPLTFSALGYDHGGSSVIDIAVDRDSNPRNGAAVWVGTDLPVTSDGTPAAVTAALSSLPVRNNPYYVWARLRNLETGEVTYSRADPLTLAPVASMTDDPLGDVIAGSALGGYEVYGVDAARVGRSLQFVVRTNYQPNTSGGGDVRLVVGDDVYGIAVNTYTTESGLRVRRGDLYRGATFLPGTVVPEVPTYLDTYASRVSGRSSVRVVRTPDRPWAYELRGSVELSAIRVDAGDEVQVGWSMYCGNDTSTTTITPTPQPPKPDLVGREVTYTVTADVTGAANGPVPVGSPFRFTARVANQGAGNAGSFGVVLYASTDATIDPATDERIGIVGTVSGLAAGTETSVVGTLTLPLTLPVSYFGEIYLGVMIDDGNAVDETDETNNRNQGDGIDRREVQLYDPIAPRGRWTAAGGAGPFASQAAAETFLEANGFSWVIPPFDAGYSRPLTTPTFSRYNGVTMPAEAFRIQAGVGEPPRGSGNWFITVQGADGTAFNPAGLSPAIGEPSPRSINDVSVLWADVTWPTYVSDYHSRF